MERKRTRRLAILASSWGTCLLPFLTLAALLVLRSTIVRVIKDSEATPTKSGAPAADVVRTDPAAALPAAGAAVAAGGGGGGGGTAAAVAAGALPAQPAPPPPRFPIIKHCSNKCHKAFDGICDEGRPPSHAPAGSSAAAGSQSNGRHLRRRQLLAVEGNPEVSELNCDLGTDCADCGPWVGTVPQGWGDVGGPVAWARATHNISMYVRRTATPRPFLAAITHHQRDPDVSAMLWHYGAMEGGITRIVHHVLSGQCEPSGTREGGQGQQQQPAGARRRLVVDVGANFGYYTVQAALYGCRVVAFEPVRRFRALLDWSIHAAGVAELVDVVELAVSDRPGPHPLVLPRDGSYWGLASINGVNVMPKEALETIQVNATTLDSWESWAPPDVRPQDLLLLKLDIEGWEANVLQGGAKLLAHNGDNVLLEYSPGIYERNNMTELAPQTALPAALLGLSRSGFSMAHLPLFGFAAPWPPRAIKGEEPLPVFEEVTAVMLQHDLDALAYRKRMEVDPGGCPLPDELKSRYGVWAHCREWMYGTHPKGFRSAFGFNTNVWATRGSAAASRQLMRLEGTAALFDEGQDMHVWTSQRRPGIGIGLIACGGIGSGHLQLFHCACPAEAPEACRQEQELVRKLAAEGKMPFTA